MNGIVKLSIFIWALRVFNHFLLIDATDRQNISANHFLLIDATDRQNISANHFLLIDATDRQNISANQFLLTDATDRQNISANRIRFIFANTQLSKFLKHCTMHNCTNNIIQTF